MSSSNINNNALDALLAESAASIGSDTSGSVTTASKSQNTFVKFDDLVSEAKPSQVFVSAGGWDPLFLMMMLLKPSSSRKERMYC